MASPMPFQPMGGWSNNGQAMPPSNDQDESGVQVRSVGLKVLYKFNREEKFDCLTRPPQTFNVQTIPLDDTTTIGVIDLRLCIQAVIDCSPELPGRECDFTIYAHDYSEPDTPLVGQGMLSAALGSLHHDLGGQAKMVTGLVTQNKLGLIMGNANKEILEVKLKFTETPRTHHQQPQAQPQPHPQYHQHHLPQSQSQSQPDMFQPRPLEGALTPTGTAEWNSFMQSNPQIGQSTSFSRGASPALSQGPPQMAQERRDSFAQAPQLQPMPPQEIPRVAPVPIEPLSDANGQGPSSRPSSRASNKAPSRRRPTGRPRGRPRKKPLEGNTSGYEDGTEGEDGPAKKRVKTTKVDKANTNPFGSEPESLRVAASTSGSLRNFRPIAMNQETAGAAGASHLQEVPRAPTPVPHGPFPGRGQNKGAPRRESAMSREVSAKPPSPQSQRTGALSPSQEDGRSPESTAQTPAYSDDSPADIGSSPPVPRTTSFMQSSPPPSSPMLPPMPEQQASQDDPLENDEMGDLFGEEPAQPAPVEKAAAPAPPRKNKIGPRRSSSHIPVQIFRMEDGPDGGQDMVHLCSFNTPDSTSAPASKKLRPLKPQPQAMPQGHNGPPFPPPNVFAAPTPPHTTDTIEKPTSPPLPESQPQQAPASALMTQEQSGPQPSMAPLPKSSAESAPQPIGDNKETCEDPTIKADSAPANQAQTGKTNPTINDKAQPQPKDPKPQPKPRKLARSQSAGPLALPTAPASEPAGPSSLSQSTTAEAAQPSIPDGPPNLRRAQSSGPSSVPASDPVGPAPSARQPSMLALPEPMCAASDAIPPPPSSPQGERSNKNVVKKNAIKQKLEAAIRRGEMPPYCTNCGAIQTPTWRKIYAQEHEGAPPHYGPGELSTKPGMVTTIEILDRDSEDKPTKYRLVKKTLGTEEDKNEWQEHLLCNPCGIWLGKTFSHRPADRWEGDAARLGRERKKRTSDPSANPRAKKARTKSGSQVNPTSEAYLPTDALGPAEPSSPKGAGDSLPTTTLLGGEAGSTEATEPKDSGAGGNGPQAGPQSTHSSGSGTAKSPVELELDEAMGTTKRLLFPSPRKGDSPKVLGEVDVNIVQTDTECRQRKEVSAEKENIAVPQAGAATEGEELEDLFRSPMPPRPSTPPSKAKAAAPATPFKTPSRQTPSHRPVTRSVSRSMRSKDSLASPVADFKRTPSRTPSKTHRADLGFFGSASKRRSPRNQHHGIDFDDNIFDTPMSRAVNQMLSEPNFGLDDEMELVSLGGVDTDPNWANFSSFFSTDAPMPSSPPKERMTFGADQATDMWDWGMENVVEVNNGK